MTWEALTDLLPLLGIVGALFGAWLVSRRPPGPPPATPTGKPSEAQAEDREARADSLARAVDRAGPHDGFDDDGPYDDEDVDSWVESK